jgi:hypothetical protein
MGSCTFSKQSRKKFFVGIVGSVLAPNTRWCSAMDSGPTSTLGSRPVLGEHCSLAARPATPPAAHSPSMSFSCSWLGSVCVWACAGVQSCRERVCKGAGGCMSPHHRPRAGVGRLWWTGSLSAEP